MSHSSLEENKPQSEATARFLTAQDVWQREDRRQSLRKIASRVSIALLAAFTFLGYLYFAERAEHETAAVQVSSPR